MLRSRSGIPLSACTCFDRSSKTSVSTSGLVYEDVDEVLALLFIDAHGCIGRIVFSSTEDLEILRDLAMRASLRLGIDSYSLIRGCTQHGVGNCFTESGIQKTDDLRRVHIDEKIFDKVPESCARDVSEFKLDPPFYDIAKNPSVVIRAIPDDVWTVDTLSDMLSEIVIFCLSSNPLILI